MTTTANSGAAHVAGTPGLATGAQAVRPLYDANAYAAQGFDAYRYGAGQYAGNGNGANDYGANHYGAGQYGAYQYAAPQSGPNYVTPTSGAWSALSQDDASSMAAQPAQFAGGTPRTTAPARFHIDQRRYWVGAVLTAAVAVLVAVLGMLIAKGVFHQSIIMRDGDGSFAVHVGAYALFTALISVLTSVLFLGICQFAPRPGLYFAWIGALGVLFTAVLPFTMSLALVSQIIFAVINVLVGVAIVTLVPVSAHSSVVRR